MRVIYMLVRLAVGVDWLRLRLPKRLRKWRGSLRSVYRRWLIRHGFAQAPPFARRGRRAWNRTPEHLEIKIVRFHVEHPGLGAGQLRRLSERVLGFLPGRETLRRIIIIRRQDIVVAMEDARRKKRRRISVTGSRQLWGVDLTLVWVLGFFSAWLLGAVEYHGSRVVTFLIRNEGIRNALRGAASR